MKPTMTQAKDTTIQTEETKVVNGHGENHPTNSAGAAGEASPAARTEAAGCGCSQGGQATREGCCSGKAEEIRGIESREREDKPSRRQAKRIAVFVSGGGTNFQALLNAKERGEIPHGEFALVIASNQKAYALERAARYGIPSLVISRKDCREEHPDNETAAAALFDHRLTSALEAHGIDLIVLAGYLSILSENVTLRYENRIINIHPALIPSFCGPGFYGLHVHKAVLARGVKLTGATVHFVNAVCDGGPIIFQKAVPVEDGDTPESLQQRVMEQAEWELLPKAVALYCAGCIQVQGNRAFLRE